MKKLNEIFDLCPLSSKCDESNYGCREECINDYEDCKLFVRYEREIEKEYERK